MLYLTGVIIAFFLTIILLSKKNKTGADKILAAWLLVTGIHLLFFYAFITDQYARVPALLGINIPFPLLHGPFLYLYVRRLTATQLPKESWIHFVPFIAGYFPFLSFFILSPEEKISVYRLEGAGYELPMAMVFACIVVSGVVYSGLSLRLLYRHQKNISDQFSFTEKINLAWLRYLIAGSVIIWLVVIFGNDVFTYASIVLYVVFIGYFGIRQTRIFTSNPDLIPQATTGNAIFVPDSQTLSEKIKYEKSALTAGQLHSIHVQLVELIQAERLYANPDLSLPDVARRLDVHPNVLSQVINTKEQKNFFDYINGHRVEAFKHKVQLPENRKFTLLALAFDCGFNSKTSFNRNFKKITGMSPSQYLNSIQVSLS